MKKLPNSTPFYPSRSIRFKLGLKSGVKSGAESGFALIATISVMALVIMIAMAMVSLSTSVVRTSQHGRAMEEAQANARMALMMAIGTLQRSMGPDQRISANAEILEHLSPNNPHWLGAWESWKAGDSSTSSVDGYSEHSTITGLSDTNIAPTYTAGREDHFVKWLVSMPETDAQNISSILNDLSNATILPNEAATSVKLIASGTAGSNLSAHVSVPLMSINKIGETSGRYGWHISDSSQKSMLIYSDNSETQDVAKNIFDQSAAPGTGYLQIAGFENLSAPEKASRLITKSTLDLVEKPTLGNDSLAQMYYHDITHLSKSVMVDVRSGGLKSDLNTLLEREINVAETGNEFMLYKFDDNNRVPLQDLAAFYQLYDHDNDWSNGRRGGVELAAITDPLQITTPDAGGSDWRTVDTDRYLKAHNAMYMRPVPIKIHYVAGVSASLLTDEDRALGAVKDRDGNITQAIDPLDTHRITIGITPTVSLWNPTNLPMVMDISQIYRLCSPPLAFRWKLYRNGNNIFTDWWNNLSACIVNESYAGGINPWSPFIANLRLKNETGGTRIVFEPGEVKVFSMEVADEDKLSMTGQPVNRIIRRRYNAKPFWDPYALQTTTNSGVGNGGGNSHVFKFSASNSNQHRQLVVRTGDELVLELGNEVAHWNLSSRGYDRIYLGRNITRGNEIIGAPFGFTIMNETFERRYEQFRNYQFLSRQGGNWSMRNTDKNCDFGGAIMAKGMPEGTVEDLQYKSVMSDPTQFPRILPAGDNNLKIDVDDVIASANSGEGLGLFEFFLAAGPELMAKDSLATGGGKLIPSRPFKHSSIIKPPFISEADNANLYHYGWDWQVRRINDIEGSSVKIDQATNKGYWGGGYTPEQGVNNIIQMRLPVAPPISVASLSHTLLGGFSIANQGMISEDLLPYYYTKGRWGTGTTHPIDEEHPIKRSIGDPLALRRTTTYGSGGLGPFTFQAIGDSYAHPNIPADKAFITKSFTYKKEYLAQDVNSGPQEVPFVDHSYLANKAIWDQYFFSSITNQPDRLGVFESTNMSAKEVAIDFFINNNKLPNKRYVSSSVSPTLNDIDTLFAEKEIFQNGLADKIATYLMAEGSFNVNSTSVAAWKALLSGLKGDKLNFLINDYTIGEGALNADTPVGVAAIQNAGSFSSSDLLDANEPKNQWTGYRTISDPEIDQLANAIVKQVKLRGPFLSMSDFINRRLDASNTAFSKLGALQAAIDDPSVTINAHFRDAKERTIGGKTGANVDSAEFAFPEAIASTDAVAYGSNPYVDQSEILQNVGNQLTVRGDTFVIRAYGDAFDQNGNVVARAWCEADVQRIPEYVDTSDSAHLDQDSLNSTINQRFGRRFVIVQFRWLTNKEI